MKPPAQMRRIGRLALALTLALAFEAWPQSVVFINPGKSDEVYWVTAARAMQAAARALDMKLEVKFAERDHLRTIDFARQLAQLPAGHPHVYTGMPNRGGRA